MSSKKSRNKVILDMEMMLFTNNPNALQYSILEMFYRGVINNTLGLMEAKNKETGEIEMILVGLDKEGEEVKTYPLARIFKQGEATNLLAPDGKGAYN